MLAYIHLPLMLWCLYGLILVNFKIKDQARLMDYLRYNGDLVVLFALVALSGMLLTGLTLGLFSTIDFDIEQIYFQYVVLWGAVAAPIVATFIIRHYPTVTEKIVPVIATLFSPLVLLTATHT